MTATAPTHTTRRLPNVGERVRLASYTVGQDSRVLYGQRIDGVVRVSDHPAENQPGRRYVIERGLEQDGYGALQALVEDYVAQAAKHQCIPVLANVVDRYLDAITQSEG